MQKSILIIRNVDVIKFINFWSDLYNYSDNENIYLDNINKVIIDDNNLLKLFEWKNGSKLSPLKQKSFDKKILSKIKIINSFKDDFNLDLFLKEFCNVSTIWKIFLLHIISPKIYPIFDQHVFRAMMYMKFSKIKEIPANNKKKEDIYFEEYVHFFNNIKAKLPINFDNKKIDESFWSFGKFLKSRYKNIL